MKKHLAILLIFLFGLLAGVCIRYQDRIALAIDLAPASRGDVNADGMINITDAVFLLNFLFLGGAPPAEPFNGCGADPSEPADKLACESFGSCP